MSDISLLPNIQKILEISTLMKDNYDQEELKKLTETKHYHVNGVYVRSLFIPAGIALTGKIHNFESIGILAQGRMRIFNGETAVIVEAPYITVDQPGIARFGYAETDCTFITVHRTDSIEISQIEDELVSSTIEEYTQKRLRQETP